MSAVLTGWCVNTDRTGLELWEDGKVADSRPFTDDELAGIAAADADAQARAAASDEAEANRAAMKAATDEVNAWAQAAGYWLASDGAMGSVDRAALTALRQNKVVPLGLDYQACVKAGITTPAQDVQFEWMAAASQIAQSMLSEYGAILAEEAHEAGLLP